MTLFQIIIITISLIVFLNTAGFIYSYIVLYTDILKPLRIQHKKYKSKILWQRLPLILFNIGTLILTATIGVLILYTWFDTTFPTLFVFTFQIVVVCLIDDAFFYFAHRWLHSKYAMQYIHRIHHKATTPFPLEYIYVHPLEWFIGFQGPMIAILLMQGINIYVFWAYLLFRNMHELDIHSGIKSVMFRFFPFWGTAEHHDKHHEVLDGNYSSTFTYLDKLFKTEIKK